MKAHLSLHLHRSNLHAFIACLLSFSLLTMPFVSVAAAASRGLERPASRSKSSQRQPAASYTVGTAAPAPFQAVIAATKTDAILNDDGDGKADPFNGNIGTTEKIEYTVTVTNNGTTDATNVVFTDQIDAHTTLVPGSITAQPIATNDTYSALGNVRIQVPDGTSDLLNNDCDPGIDPAPCSNAGLTVSVLGGDNSAPFAGTSAQGGQVTATTGDGSFQYNPAPGFEGTDTFTYTVIDSTGKTDTATVTITVSGMIWFISAAAPAGGDGRLTNPFNCLVGTGCFSTTTGDEPGDFIFVFSGTYNDTAALVLLNNQKLIGAAATAPLAGAGSITGFTVPAHSDALPGTNTTSPIINSSASGIQLASGNLLRGFTVGNTATSSGNYDILNTATATVGTLNILEVALNGTGGLFRADSGGTLNVSFPVATTTSAGSNGVHIGGVISGSVSLASGAISGVAGADVAINGGTVALTCASGITHAANSATVDIANHATGVVTFSGGISATNGTGLQFNNADSTYNFNGTNSLNGGDAGVDITNGSGGTFNFSATTSIGSTNASPAFNVGSSPGTPNVDFNGTITQNNAQGVVNIDGTTGGAITFDGTVTGGAPSLGVDINNAGGSVSFTSTLTLGTSVARAVNQAVNITGGSGAKSFNAVSIFTTGPSAIGFGATNSTGAITIASGTVNAAGAAAVNIAGTASNNRTPLNIQLTTVAANGGSNGLVLTNTSATASPGGFRVLGTASGSDRCGGFIDTAPLVDTIINPVAGECTGGRITATTGAGDVTPTDNSGIGVRLVNADTVVLQRMQLDGHTNMALYGNNVNGFTLNNSLVNGTNGDDAATEDNAMTFDNLLGSATISASSISGGHEDNLDVENSTGTLDRLSITNSNFGGQSTSFGEDGLVFSSTGNPTMKLTVNSCRFQHGRSDLLQSVARDASTLETVILNSIFDNDHPNTLSGGGGIVIEADAAGDSPTHTFNVSNNTFRDALGVAVNIFKGPGSGSMSGTISGNTIGVSGVTDSGSVQGSGISVDGDGLGSVTVAVTNNVIRQYGSGDAIHLNAGNSEAANQGDVALNATVTGNTAEQPGTFGSNALELNVGTNTGNTNPVCLDAQNNTFENGGSVPNFEDDINLRQRQGSVVRMPGYAGGAQDTTAVQTYMANRNPGNETVIASASGLGGSGYFNTIPAGSACPSAVAPTGAVSFNSFSTPRNETFATVRTESGAEMFSAAAASVSSAPETPVAKAARSTASRNTKQTQVSDLRTPATARKSATVNSHHAVIKGRRANASYSSASPMMMSGETVTINIGTLRAGDSVTITFQVTVDNPPGLTLLTPTPRVRNQGTVNFLDGATPGSQNTNEEFTEVDLFDTTTNLVSDLNPSNFGEPVTFTATVSENPAQGSVDPTGTVDFIDTSNSNAVVCDNVALSGGTAQCQTSSLTAGTHNIRADYSGDGNFDPSQSNVVAQVVNACTPDPVVTSTADSGAGSLREALANVCSGDTITFDITGTGPHTITLTTGELVVDTNVTINNNSGESITVSGGGTSRVFNINATKTAAIIGLNITGGGSTGAGGAIINDGALTIVNSVLFGNSSTIDGGAISTTATGTALTLINTTISGNSAAGSGGGLITLGGTVNIINSTISNNTADSDNNSAGSGGGIRAHAGTVTLKNTIVAGNFNEDGASDAADDISGTVDAASSFNLIGTGGAGGLTNGVNNNQVGVANAGLGPLANNGGTTQTHALLPTSTAVEAGSNGNLPADTFDLDGDANTAETLSTDQRGNGFPRVADSSDANTTQTVDIGAFELHPTVEDITDKSVAEDNVLSFSFNLGDGTGSLIQSVTATSSNTTLVPNANISVTGSGSTRNIQITPATNANSPADGTATITVTVTATNGQSAVDTFVLTVTEVNDNPDAVNDTLTGSNEDSGLRVIPFADLLGNDSAGPANESTQTITVTNVANPVGGTVAINGTNVEFTLAANFSGTASFDYTITDNGTTNGAADPKSDTASASFSVNSVNDPPSFVKGADQTVNEDAGPQTVPGWATSISAGPNEIQNLTFNVQVTGTTGNLSFLSAPAIDATTGTLTYTTAANTNGTANLSVTLSDDGSNTPPNSNTSAAQTFTITVNAVNDAPTFQLGANPSINEDAGPQTINGFAFNFQPGPATATDESGQTLVGYTVTQTGSTGGLTFSATPAISNAGTLTFTANNNTSGTATFDVVATDSGSGTPPNVNQSAPVSFTITVGAVNDPPVNTVPGPQGTNQNTPLTFSSGNGNQISVADPDAGTNTIQVTLTAANGTITLNGTSGLSFSFSDANGTGTGDGTADPTMTFRGTIANINTALNGMVFTPAAGFSGAASLTITSNDLGNTGSGGPQTDTDVVNIQVSTNISIQDAQVAEPTSGSANMIFTVTLSAPAPAGGSSVNFTTQQEAPAINHATAGSDYTTTTGTVNFAMGEQVKTISVPVLADGNAAEANETFLVVLSSPVNATIADGTATGTILIQNQAGTLLISEIRTSGPAGAGDDFVEIYNNTNSPHTVNGTGGGYGVFTKGATCNAAPVLVGVIPNGTVIPARGHYLFVGSAYSLANYGGTGAAAGDQTLLVDLDNDANVGLFSTGSVVSISSVNRLDAVGFGLNTGGSCDLLREGTTLPSLGGSVLEHSFVRDECGKKGNPSNFGACPTGGGTKDSNVNNNDFVFVDTTAAVTPAGRVLGAPGPQNLGSPQFTTTIFALLLDATKGSTAAPNRVRDNTPVTNGANGTLSIRRRFVNGTGAPVTRLRFRIVDISALATGPGNADIRALTSGNVTVTGIQDSATCQASNGSSTTPCTVTVFGTTLEQPPTQAMGGAFNSSYSTGTITLATPLAPGASINLQLLLGVQTTGSFKFFFNIEALP